MILTALVLPSYIFTTACIDSEVALGDSLDASFTVRIDNIGNIRDSYMISCISGNEWKWDYYGGDSGLKIEPGESANASIFLRTGDMPYQGSYHFRLRIDTTSGIGHQEIPVTVVVREFFDHSLSAEMWNESVYPSETASGELTVNSSANGNDVYMISWAAPDGWSVEFESARLETLPFQLLPANFTITVPEGANAGRYMVDLVVSSTGSNNTRTLRIPVFVREVYLITWEIIGVDEDSPMNPGSVTNISIRIFNGGNIRDRVVITMSSWGVNWMSLKDSTLLIDPGSTNSTQITIRIPVNATPMAFSLGIKIDSLGSDGSSRNLTIQVGDPGRTDDSIMPWYSYVAIVLIAVILLLILASILYSNFRKHN